jgi:hypothetical protein
MRQRCREARFVALFDRLRFSLENAGTRVSRRLVQELRRVGCERLDDGRVEQRPCSSMHAANCVLSAGRAVEYYRIGGQPGDASG